MNDEYIMSQSSQLLPPLKPSAFHAVKSIEFNAESKQALYGSNTTYVDTYPIKIKGADQQKQLFQAQFQQLLDEFTKWGQTHAAGTAEAKEGIATIKNRIFSPGYADQQPAE